MSIFEYMSMVVAIVLGISITNLLNKLAITLRVGSWATLWFRPLWCVILLICIMGYLWGFWWIYSDYTQISIWSFIAGPLFTVVCFFLTSVLLPIPADIKQNAACLKYFLDERKPFFIVLAVLWGHLNLTVLFLGFAVMSLEDLLGYVLIMLSLLGYWLRTAKGHQILVVVWSLSFLIQEALQLAIE